MALNNITNISKQNLPTRNFNDGKNDLTYARMKGGKEKDLFAMPLVVMPEKRRPLRTKDDNIKCENNVIAKGNLKSDNQKLTKDIEIKVKSNIITTARIAAAKKTSLNRKKAELSKIKDVKDSKLKKVTMAKKNQLSATGRNMLSSKAVKKFKTSHKKILKTIKPDIDDSSSNTADEYTDALSSLKQDSTDQGKNKNNILATIISPVKSFSSLTLKDVIVDVDIKDVHDEFQCSAYIKDIYNYMCQIEKKISVDQILSPNVNVHMRVILIDWIIQIHQHYKLLPETLYLTVDIIDRYLQVCETVHKKTLQLVGVTAMFIACKFEELYIMEVRDFVHVTKNTYTIADILTMEIAILKALDFSFTKPYSIQFLRRYSKVTSSLIHHTVAKFFLELSLLDFGLANQYPSLMAASALDLSMVILKDLTWDSSMEHYSNYNESMLRPTMQSLLGLFVKSTKSDHYKSVISKYSSPKLMNVPKLIKEFLGDGHTL